MFASNTEYRIPEESLINVTQTARFWPRLFTLVFAGLAVAAPSRAEDSVISLMNPSPTGTYLAGQQALQVLDAGQASRFFLDGATEEWDNPVLVDRAFVSLAGAGKMDDAKTIARHLVELDPQNELGHLVLAAAALKERRYNSVPTELEPIGTDTFVGITGALMHAWAEIGLGDVKSANKVLDDIGRSGLDDFLVFHRALMADVAGETDTAIALAKKAYEGNPLVPRVVEAYARILANAGRFTEAMKPISDFENQGLDDPLVSQVKLDIEKKIRPGKLAANAQEGAAEMFHSIGSALLRDGSTDIAMVFMRIGLYLDPADDMIAMSLAGLLEGAGRPDEANAIYAEIPRSSPYRTSANVRTAENLDALGQRSEAIRRLQNMVAVNPDNLDAVSVLGDILRSDKQYAAAAEAYSQALRIAGGGNRPSDWRFFYVRGIAYERNKEWPKAEADFKAALKLNPNQPQVLNYLGYSWVDKGIHLTEALDMIKRAVSADPSDGYVVDSLGWAYYRLGRLSEAVQTMEQAVKLRPNDPEINDHLGDVYWKVGRKLEARFQWTIARDLDTEGAVKARVEEKLKNGLDAAAPTNG
ncbi:MAG TPA: tetratricopeptide repeat protein [Devosiaceae bacterium]